MCGDGHAAQGDGEVDLTAIETSLTGTFRLDLIKGKSLNLAARETADALAHAGLHEDLNEAMRWRSARRITFLGSERASRARMPTRCQHRRRFDVTQVVDGVKGITG